MSREVPENIGELSTWAMQQALDRIGHYLIDSNAPQELLDALSVVRLVEGMPRQAPWWGVSVPTPEGDTVSVGTLLRNAFEALGDHIDYPTREGLQTRAEHYFTRRHLPAWRAGRRAYNDYLDHLLDPQEWERGQAKRLEAAEADRIRDHAMTYLHNFNSWKRS
jgi:hypothetical protein